MLKSTVTNRRRGKKFASWRQKNVFKGLTLSIIITTLIISGSSQLNLSSGKKKTRKTDPTWLMLVQDLQPRSAGGAVAPQDHLRVQTISPMLEEPIVWTPYKPQESFFGCKEKGLPQWGGKPEAQQLSGWKIRSGRVLGLLQHVPGSWELGKFVSNKSFSMKSVPSQPRGVSQEAAGTTGSEIERDQVLSSNTRGELTPFSSTELRWPQTPSPEGATLFHYSL